MVYEMADSDVSSEACTKMWLSHFLKVLYMYRTAVLLHPAHY